MVDEAPLLTIGELSRRTGVAASALRYYERIGLLSPATRAAGRRYYRTSSAERIALIRLCRDAGFTLAETRVLLAAGSRRQHSSMRLMEGKLVELEASIARATRARALIQHALACPHSDLETCPSFRRELQARLHLPEQLTP